MSWLPNWLTGEDPEHVAEGEAAEARSRALTEDLKRRGLISEENYRVALEHYDTPDDNSNPEAVQDAFDDELSARAGAVRNFAGGLVNAGLKSTLGLIPWQVWAGLAVYLAWRFGVFNGILAKAKR